MPETISKRNENLQPQRGRFMFAFQHFNVSPSELSIASGNTPPKFINSRPAARRRYRGAMKAKRQRVRVLQRARVLSGLLALCLVALAEFWMAWRFGCDCARAVNQQEFGFEPSPGLVATR
jgi:hypothetical protein